MDFIQEYAQRTEIKKSCDVLVAGGGVAGIAAALAAARSGADVILTEKQCLLGGLATLGMVVIYLPLCDGCGNQVMFGIAEELLKLSIQYGYEVSDHYGTPWLEGGTKEEKIKCRYQTGFNPHMFAISAEQLLRREGVRILYDTKIVDTAVENDRITAVIIDNKEGRGAIRVKSVVDCTGDADICAFAGEETAEFTENRFNYWAFFSQATGYNLAMNAVPLHTPLPEGERGYDGLKNDDVNEFLYRNHDTILADVLKKREESGDNSIMPVTIQTIPPVRMTRRLVGAYELDESEEGKAFDDSIGKVSDWRKAGPVFSVPYRCICGTMTDNLLVAGRCISVTTDMWDITRCIPQCAVTGEAAGTAAAMNAKNGGAARNLDITVLRDTLGANGVLV